MLGRALRRAWEAAFAAEYARNADTLEEIRALASQIEERAAGGERDEAHRLAVFCAACSEDIRAGVPHDSALGRLFRRN
jgi:hypothetical protein